MALPLVVLEPLYLMIARKATGLRLRVWWRRSLVPVIVLTALPMTVAALVWAATSAVAPTLAGWLPAVSFIVAWCLSLALTRRFLPMEDVLDALRSRM